MGNQVRGRGLSCYYLGVGFMGRPNPSTAEAALLEDGRVEVRCGVAELGQKLEVTLRMLAAAELEVPVDRVVLVHRETDLAPNSGVTAASRQTYISGGAILKAVQELKSRILDEASEVLESGPEGLVYDQGNVVADGPSRQEVSLVEIARSCQRRGRSLSSRVTYNPPVELKVDPETGYGKPYASYSVGVTEVEVEVDLDTGQVTVSDIVCITDVGKAIFPKSVEGQIQGGAAMGLGYALMEDAAVREGRVSITGFHDYLVPTSLDVPAIRGIIHETPDPHGPFGARGFGELTVLGVAPAVLAAIKKATGVRLRNLPVTPERVYAALRKQESLQSEKEVNR